MQLVHTAKKKKKQIINKGSVGGGLMSCAKCVISLDTWSGFSIHNNMKKQRPLLNSIKKNNYLLQHALPQATTLVILG